MVCTRMPHESVAGKRVRKVWQVGSTTRAVVELADHHPVSGCRAGGGSRPRITGVRFTMCWKPVGLVVWLVNAARAKNVSGRPKTDRIDAV